MKCPWNFVVDGDDLVVKNITATCFGGKYDLGDNGETESGWKNNGDGSEQSNTFQVALPIRSIERATQSSPIAFKGQHIPWLSVVKVWREQYGEETAVKAVLTDNGPDISRFPNHAIDLNPPLAQHFAPYFPLNKIANNWEGTGFSYRIIGGAKYIS